MWSFCSQDAVRRVLTAAADPELNFLDLQASVGKQIPKAMPTTFSPAQLHPVLVAPLLVAPHAILLSKPLRQHGLVQLFWENCLGVCFEKVGEAISILGNDDALETFRKGGLHKAGAAESFLQVIIQNNIRFFNVLHNLRFKFVIAINFYFSTFYIF